MTSKKKRSVKEKAKKSVNPEEEFGSLRNLPGKNDLRELKFGKIGEKELHVMVQYLKRKEMIRVLWGACKSGRVYLARFHKVTGEFSPNLRQIYEGQYKVKTKLLGRWDTRYPAEIYRSQWDLELYKAVYDSLRYEDPEFKLKFIPYQTPKEHPILITQSHSNSFRFYMQSQEHKLTCQLDKSQQLIHLQIEDENFIRVIYLANGSLRIQVDKFTLFKLVKDCQNLQHDITLYHADLLKPKKIKVPILKDIPTDGMKGICQINWIGQAKLVPYKLLLLPTDQGLLLVYKRQDKFKHRVIMASKHVSAADFLTQSLILACISNEILLYNKESDRILKKLPVFPSPILTIRPYDQTSNALQTQFIIRDTESLRIISLSQQGKLLREEVLVRSRVPVDGISGIMNVDKLVEVSGQSKIIETWSAKGGEIWLNKVVVY